MFPRRRLTPVFEQPISNDLDINGWELRKALGLLGKGNATLIEWLDSPIVYRADPVFLQRLRVLAAHVYQPRRAFHHYVHMARGNYRDFLTREQVRLKEYLQHAPTEIASDPAPTWMGLKILSTKAGGPEATEGWVEFVARYQLGGRPLRLHERSHFVREDGFWRYVAGVFDPLR